MYEAKDYEVRIWWSANDGFFIAQCVDMPGISTDGKTRVEAAASLEQAIELALEVYKDHESEPPTPRRHAVAA
jgi:predicted RNase H-like HicB family nuclease